MRKIFLIIALFVSANVFANDTIKVNLNDIKEIIRETETNVKGKATTKYYVIYKGKLIKTTKTSIKDIELAIKHKADCDIYLIINNKGKKTIKTL
jgi:outer membrane lipoprotein-sorting protein